MQIDTRNLSLFGLDLEGLLQRWRAGWRELLWGPELGLRQTLEAPVALQREGGVSLEYYVAETPLPAHQAIPDTAYRAVLLPASRVLLRELHMPAALEADLEEALALEVQASSPFAADDTCFGWALGERKRDKLTIVLAITAVSEVMAYIHSQGIDTLQEQAMPEVWCLSEDGKPIVLHGFGEQQRAADYRRRLGWLAILGVAAAVLVCGLLAVPGLVRSMQADNMDYHYARAVEESAAAMELRERLAVDNERAQAVQQMLDGQFDYYRFLDELTARTPDSVYLEQISMEDGKVQMRGWAANAAEYMEMLSEQPGYVDVRAPTAFRRHERTQLEQFVLELRLAGEPPG